ncbi:Protein Muted like protein [Chelonia mydas]|uniref:Biogenesis of lysosome-related organelles complex 1 subunit 5 n=1 Tax=Chelonia mydas TaxID=8469 RepID=M7BHT4_CHEMY|nr:Protein Muted like protein [Chelonia mydas]
MRVLENLNTMVYETNDQILPKCEQVMHDDLNEALKRCHQICINPLSSSRNSFYNFPFSSQLQTDTLMAGEKQRLAHWEMFMKDQHNKRAEVDEEHRKAMERLKEQYAEMDKDLAKFSSF